MTKLTAFKSFLDMVIAAEGVTPGPLKAHLYQKDSIAGPLYQVMQETSNGSYAINGFHSDMSEADAKFFASSRTITPALARIIREEIAWLEKERDDAHVIFRYVFQDRLSALVDSLEVLLP